MIMHGSIFEDRKQFRIFVIVIAVFYLTFGTMNAVFQSLPIYTTFVDTLINMSLFVVLFIALANSIRYSIDPDTMSIGFILRGGMMAWVFCLISIAINYAVCADLFADEVFYIEYLRRTLPIRFGMTFMLMSNALMLFVINIYKNGLKEKQENEVKLLEKIKEAELETLKSQINPHFLFNSLNSISYMTMLQPDSAQEMVLRLSDYLRYTLKHSGKRLQPFEEELANIKRYLEIEKVRFGDKIRFVTEISPDCMKAEMPFMLLQPLYENAVKFGLNESTEPLLITTRSRMSGNILVIEIQNNYFYNDSSQKGTGIGLKNIRERLKLTYNSENLMTIIPDKNKFIVKILIPQLNENIQ